MSRLPVALAMCVALAACGKPAPKQVANVQAPQAPQVRIGQAGSVTFVPTVAVTGTVAVRKVPAAAPGSPTVAEARSYVLHATVPAADAARITLGASTQVTFAAFENDTIVGRVTALTGGGVVEVALPNDSRFAAGQSGQARITAKGTPTRILAVPPSALFARQGQAAKVYVVDLATSRLHMRTVTLGEQNSAGIAITTGLKLGEWVALTRPDTLHDGMQIAPLGPE